MINQPYLRMHIKPGKPGRSLSAEELAEAMADQLGNGGAVPGCRLPPVKALAQGIEMLGEEIRRAL